jgi:hypothetical protein
MIFSTATETNIANDNHRRHSGASKSPVADLDNHICRTRVIPSSGTPEYLAPQISNFRIGPLPRTVRNDEK